MIKIVHRSGVALTAAAFLLAAAPASAGSAEAASSDSVVATAAPSHAKASGRERRYCVDQKFTGSRLATRICKTKKEWEAEGVEMPPK